MCRMQGSILWIILLLMAAGCSKQAGTDPPAAVPKSADATAATDNAAATENAAAPGNSETAKLDGPAATTREFLEALRTGSDDKATALLSKLAREKTAALNRKVTPPASDYAKYTVGKVDYLDGDRAAVACTWTDLDSEGQPKTDQHIWVLRHEPEGWRVAGISAHPFPNEPAVTVHLNFEDPDDMFRKLQWVDDEYRRREKEAGDLQAQETENQEKSVLR
jgi:hypothetical protein